MLNKNVPYKNIIMRRDFIESNNTAPILPPGFSIKLFEPKDILKWAEIEVSVLEFDDISKTVNYFENTYMPRVDDLKERCIFICNEKEEAVATSMAWFTQTKEFGKQLNLHWVSVMPEYQGKGLGKALVLKVLEIYNQLDNDQPIYLHTQTWSDKAIKLYHKLGFNFCRNSSFPRESGKVYQNDYEDALEVLKLIYDEDFIKQLTETSVF